MKADINIGLVAIDGKICGTYNEIMYGHATTIKNTELVLEAMTSIETDQI